MKDRYFICILLIIIIVCAGILIFKENDRYKYNEQKYQAVYAELNQILDSSLSNDIVKTEENETYNELKNNVKLVDSILTIKKIDLFYPITRQMSDENLKISPTKFYGPEANQIGNYCIVGHNFHSEDHFSRLKELEVGDQVFLTDTKGKKVEYVVFKIYEVKPEDVSCLSQNNGEIRELTLITCTNDTTKRLIVKCKEV